MLMTLGTLYTRRLEPAVKALSCERLSIINCALCMIEMYVDSSGQPDPEAWAGAGAATDSEGKVCVPLVDAMLEGSGAMAPVLLVDLACESDLKGYVSIVFLPAPLVLAPALLHLERFDGWMLGSFQDDVQATAASLRASSPVPVWKGMLKV